MISFFGENHLLAFLIIEELSRLGVSSFVLSPGSRSTPLALALESKRAKTKVHIDERGAAYFGFGSTLATGTPTALVCTSGTAVANYLPAVVESSQSSVPLIIISADRPSNLINTGSNQTIKHLGIFSSYVRDETQLNAPQTPLDANRVLRSIDEIFQKATGINPGPVHINVSFEKPLIKSENPVQLPAKLNSWFISEAPLCDVTHGSYRIPEGKKNTLERIKRLLLGSNNGIILTSGIDGVRCNPDSILELAQFLQWPIIADITSGLRLGVESPLIFKEASVLFDNTDIKNELAPDRILHIGTLPVSQVLIDLLENCPLVGHCSMDSQRSDTVGNNFFSISSDPKDLLNLIKKENFSPTPSWLLEKFERLKTQLFKNSNLVRDASKGSEISAVETVVANIPNNWQLYLANSLPIRLVDSSLSHLFKKPSHGRIRIGYHRGASGIDGTVAAAAGFASGSKTPTILLIGDLAAIHDCNSFIFAKQCEVPLLTIIINNGGGGIFSTLPALSKQLYFEDFFVTPQAVNFEGLSNFVGLDYISVNNDLDLAKAISKATQLQRSSLIEVIVDWRHTQPALLARRDIISKVISNLSNLDC